MLVHTAVASSDSVTATTPALNITGANAIIAIISTVPALQEARISDTAGNSWTGTTIVSQADPATGVGNICVLSGLNTASGYTNYQLTYSGGTQFPAIALIAVDGFGALEHTAQGGSVSAATTVQSGSITASGSNRLIVACLEYNNTTETSTGIDTGFTLTDAVTWASGASLGAAAAYLFQNTSGGTVNPNWTWTGSSNATGVIASFTGTFPSGNFGSGSTTQTIYFNNVF